MKVTNLAFLAGDALTVRTTLSELHIVSHNTATMRAYGACS